VDTYPGGPLAIGGFSSDAVPAIPPDYVVRHRDALKGILLLAAQALPDVLTEVAVMKHAVVADLAGRSPTGCPRFLLQEAV
jgi:hypothetical protein